MTRSRQAIERALTLFEELLRQDPELAREYEASREDFSSASDAAARDEAERHLVLRRHLEWFVLERPSAHLDGVPVEALQEAWLERAGEREREYAGALLGSLAGAFEVTSADEERGLWIRDLFGTGEYPVEEEEAASELQTEDLLVGRIFPIGDASGGAGDGAGLFRLSPSAVCFRNPSLLVAVRRDLERMRASRRGVLRIQQLELERLFFRPQGIAAVAADLGEATPPPSTAELLAEARTELLAAGVPDEHVPDILELVRQSPHGTIVTEVLNELAFETTADLERARRALVELWSLTPRDQEAKPETAPARRVPGRDAAAALANFEAGRAAGRDLDQLFRELEEELGVGPTGVPDEDGEEIRLPDFPGVVGAVVEEFFWELEQEEGPEAVARVSSLRKFAAYAEGIGVFENLGARDLLDYAGRWLLDEGRLEGPAQAEEALQALGVFCRWCEERQSHPLWTEFGATHEGLLSSVPRILELRAHAELDADEPHASYEVLDASDAATKLRDEAGSTLEVHLSPAARKLARPGDVLHARLDDGGRARLAAAYPPELRGLLHEPPRA